MCGAPPMSVRGTTSACAENTLISSSLAFRTRNYLRVRGEYLEQGFSPSPHEELPPRARRIPGCSSPGNHNSGTTSACAENTPIGYLLRRGYGNYLRVRGEYRLEHQPNNQ